MAPERAARRYGGLVALWLLAGPLAAESPQPSNQTSDPGAASAELTELRARIGAVQQQLNAARAQESELAGQLRSVEQRIGHLTRSLRTVKTKLRDEERRLNDLQAKYTTVNAELDAERKLLARQLRAAYLLGRQEQVKLLLNQEDPARLGRMLTYYRYLNHTRLVRIDRVETVLQRLNQLQEQIAVQREELAATQSKHAAEMVSMAEERSERESLLKKLRADIRNQDDELASLQKDEKRLEQLLAQLQRALADLSPAGKHREPFAKLKRKLPWPVSGKLEGRFNERRELGNLRWRGAFITAPLNRDVRAVSNGRVAFADWLRGFGLLIIIDHGDDYMTLYGHNQALFKDVGDWVEPGEVIASVGDTGGLAKSGLYFELRHKGDPQNPQKWCAGSPSGPQAAR